LGQTPYGQTSYGQQASAEGETAGYPSAPSEQPYYVPTAHQQAWSAAQHYPGEQFWTEPPAKPRSHRLLLGSVAAAAATALAVGGIAVAVDRTNDGSSQQTALNAPTNQNPLGQNGTGQTPQYGNGFGLGGGSVPAPGSGSSGTQTTGPATTAQQVGVVNITTTLNYGEGRAAGTGIVLTSDGEILTNNHVIENSTAITVTVVSTGKSYTATVVGTDPSDDVSVLQLKDASGLATAKLGDSDKVAVGDAVTAVGNAGGTGGTPSAARGTVTALNQSLTASDANGGNAERLTGMIQVDAAIEAGDSGGPLYDNATGTVIGIDTAASSASARPGTGSTTGFAIPIDKALSIADQIESGKASSTVHIGYPAFLGVQLSPTSQSNGAGIAGVVSGSAAAKAGLKAGDTITAVDGTTITSASGLSSVMTHHKPGDQLQLRYTDSGGQSHSITVTLGSGPAD
jgi:S1-C subfamily serine protease